MKLTLTILVVILFSCTAPKKFSENYQIICENTSTDATYSVLVSYQSNDTNADFELIKLTAVDGVLFRGITGTNGCITQKPLLTVTKTEIENNALYKKIYGKEKSYNKYITNIYKENEEIVATDKKKISYKYTFKVAVNKDLLRKDLQSAGLIKPLNAGF